MVEISRYAPSHFSWTDLGTADLPAMKRFYNRLFGWTFEDMPGGPKTYSIARLEGKDVCALHESALRHWMVYVSSDDVDRTAKEAENAGGKIFRAPVDILDKGRLALVEDPTGAKFGLWKPRKHGGAQLAGVPGTVAWRELITSNIDFAGQFYSLVFGWNPGVQNFGDMSYYLFSSGGEDLAGMMPVPKKGFASQWLNYWQVVDCDKTVELACRLGAQVLTSAMDIPGVGRFAILADSQDSVFGVIQPK